MIYANLILFLTMLLWSRFKTIRSEEEFDRIVVLTRHGDRAPLVYYPAWDDSKTTSKYWPYGLGHLSKLGKRRIYRNGRYLKKKYESVLDKITPRDVYAQSSGVDRCLETAQVLLAALFPPKGEWKWAEKIQWQPIPIKSWPPAIDPMLVANSNCPTANELYERIPVHDEVKKFLAPYETLMREINQKFQSGSDYRSMRDFFDNILALRHDLRSNDLDLPTQEFKWLNDSTYQELRTVFEFSFLVDFTGKIEEGLRQFRAGLLINTIIDMLDTRTEHRRLNILSSHDSVIFHLLDALGYELSETFKFGVTLLFGSKKQSNGEIDVTITMINEPRAGEQIKEKNIRLEKVCPIKSKACRITVEKLRFTYKFLLVKDYQEWAELCKSKIN